MRYLVVDENLFGTSIRGSVEGGWRKPFLLGIYGFLLS